MKKIIFIISIVVFSVRLNGQISTENVKGKVSFVSSQNIYVKFLTTNGISTGDTLYILSKGKLVPALIVNNLSSVSCSGTVISSLEILVDDQLIAVRKNSVPKSVDKIPETKNSYTEILKDSVTIVKKPALSQQIRGYISAYSYSGFSNTPAPNSTQLRYTFSLDAKNIGNSKLSVENYMSFRHKIGDWSAVKSNIFDALKIYSLALKYDVNKSTQISIGRRINPKISTIGAMDGLQVEKSLNKLSIGALAGYRPSFADYSFDRHLFQYGAYLAYSSVTAEKYSESSFAFMEQMNSGKTDRRFLYFQHSNSMIKNLYFYSAFEVDLYKLKGDTVTNYLAQNTFNLTGAFLSLRYKLSKKLTLSGSYDGRKNVIYYESFKTYLDLILETAMRSSFRLQADYRISNNLVFGLQTGYRFLKTDPRPSKNLYGYLTYSQIPGLNLSVTLSGTYLESSYVNSKILGATFNHDFFSNKLSANLGYRYLDYKYPESLSNTVQNVGEMSLFMQLSRKISFSISYEGTFEKQNKYNRFYLQLRKRF